MNSDIFPDIERYKRQGFPEAIYSPGKTVDQIIRLVKEMKKEKVPIIITKTRKEVYQKIKKIFPQAKYYKVANLITMNPIKPKTKSFIATITAGTSDIPVAEEAGITAEVLGNRVERIYDVGVAGLHRLFKYVDKIKAASCVIVCAGMEGTLPSIVGGLVSCPVVGVPVSSGYGVSFSGLNALLTMLNSCAANVCCVNIDDGFGAGVIASLINKKSNK